MGTGSTFRYRPPIWLVTCTLVALGGLALFLRTLNAQQAVAQAAAQEQYERRQLKAKAAAASSAAAVVDPVAAVAAVALPNFRLWRAIWAEFRPLWAVSLKNVWSHCSIRRFSQQDFIQYETSNYKG